jgi:WXG100 family type VII secretion target
MGDMVSVQYQAFEAAADNFASSLGKLQATWDDLNQKVTQLTASDNGLYAQALTAARNEVNQGMAGMQDVLRRIAAVIPEAQSTYQTADKTAASFFS